MKKINVVAERSSADSSGALRPPYKWLILFFLLFFGFCGTLQSAIVINEVAPASSPDWVELYNNGSADVNIGGWTLDDVDAASGNEVVIFSTFPAVPAGAYVVIYIDANGTDDLDFSDNVAHLYSGTATTVSLAETEDEVALYNSSTQNSTTIVDFMAWCSDGAYGGVGDQTDAVNAGIWTSGDYFAYTDPGSGYSIGLTNNGVDNNSSIDWKLFTTPTEGATNGGGGPEPGPGGTTAKPLDVVINEVAWMGTAASSSAEWLELFNNSTAAITMTKWTLEDDGGVFITFTNAHTIPAGGYFLIEDAETDTSVALDAEVTGTWSLSNDGEKLILKDSAGTIIDTVGATATDWYAGKASPDYMTMERINPKGSGTSSSNWKTNDGVTRNGTDADGNPINGTPKSQNSVYSIAEPGSDFLIITQSPFSPYGDGLYNMAKITYNTSETSKITLKIYNVKGNVVKTLIQQQDGGTSKYEIWDGTDDDGNKVPVGVYIVHLEATDITTGSVKKDSKTIVVGRKF